MKGPYQIKITNNNTNIYILIYYIKSVNSISIKIIFHGFTYNLNVRNPNPTPTRPSQIKLAADNVTSTLYVAKKYNVLPVEKACVHFLQTNLCPDNAFMLLSQVRATLF